MKRCPICNTKIIMQDSARCSSCEAEKLRRELQAAQLAHFSTTNRKVAAEEQHAEMAIECNVMLTEIADLRARLQTAEQQLGQVREEVKGLKIALRRIADFPMETEPTGAFWSCVDIAKDALEALKATPSDGCGKGRVDITAWIAQARRKFKLDKDSSAPWSHYHFALEDLEKFLAASSKGKGCGS